METLPLELICDIAERLEQWTVFWQTSHYYMQMEEPADQASKAIGTKWLVHTAASRRDLCNLRLTCRFLHSHTLGAFGRLLGDRMFRKSRIGLKDLEDISSCIALRLHIRTLRFGTAEFLDSTYNPLNSDIFRVIPEPDRSRLMDAYDVEYSWEFLNNYHEEHSTYREDLTAILLQFPNLSEVRLSYYDYPGMNRHLGQWLGPDDKAIVDKAIQSCQGSPKQSLYTWGNYDSLRSIVEAMQNAASAIRVLRLGRNTEIIPFADNSSETTSLFPTLRHLCLDIDPEALCAPERTQPPYDYFSFFMRLSHVTEVAIAMGSPEQFPREVDHTSVFHHLLKPLTCLRRLAIDGHWYFPRNELVALVSNHSTSLTDFTLTGPMITRYGLASALRSILTLPMPQLRHMELSKMVHGEAVWKTLRYSSRTFAPTFDDDTSQDFIDDIRAIVEEYATCDVILSSGGHKYAFHPRLLIGI